MFNLSSKTQQEASECKLTINELLRQNGRQPENKPEGTPWNNGRLIGANPTAKRTVNPAGARMNRLTKY